MNGALDGLRGEVEALAYRFSRTTDPRELADWRGQLPIAHSLVWRRWGGVVQTDQDSMQGRSATATATASVTILDAYESDDTRETAKGLVSTQAPQVHDFHVANNPDFQHSVARNFVFRQ